MDTKDSIDIERPDSVANGISPVPTGRVDRDASESLHHSEDDNLISTVETPAQEPDLRDNWGQLPASRKKLGLKLKKGVKQRRATFEVATEG